MSNTKCIQLKWVRSVNLLVICLTIFLSSLSVLANFGNPLASLSSCQKLLTKDIDFNFGDIDPSNIDLNELPKISLSDYKYIREIPPGEHLGEKSKTNSFPIFEKNGKQFFIKTQDDHENYADYKILSFLNAYDLGVKVYGIASYKGKHGVVLDYYPKPMETKHLYLAPPDVTSIYSSVIDDIDRTFYLLERAGVESAGDAQFMIVDNGSRALLFDTSLFRSNFVSLLYAPEYRRQSIVHQLESRFKIYPK